MSDTKTVSNERLAEMLGWCDRVSKTAMGKIDMASGLSTLDNWYFQALTPDTMRSLLSEVQSLRASLAAASSGSYPGAGWVAEASGLKVATIKHDDSTLIEVSKRDGKETMTLTIHSADAGRWDDLSITLTAAERAELISALSERK